MSRAARPQRSARRRLEVGRLERTDVLGAIGTLPATATVSLALTDLDGFADLNVRLGRGAGNAVIREWEAILAASVPTADLVARIGGDEYAIVVADSSPEAMLVALDTARSRLERHDELPAPVTVSIGVAGRPVHADAAEELWSAAIEALMRAKRDGRNRVAIYTDEKMVLKSSYYPRGTLERLAKLAAAVGRTEASLLREAVDDVLGKHNDVL